jgi:hypothetical protein
MPQYTYDPDQLARAADYGSLQGPIHPSERADVVEAVYKLAEGFGTHNLGAGGALAGITRDAMLKGVGQIWKKFSRPEEYANMGTMALPNLKYRIKALAKEIREAPEWVFKNVEGFGPENKFWQGGSWNLKDKILKLGGWGVDPKALRHELAHSWEEYMPSEIQEVNKWNKYISNTARHYRDIPGYGDKMEKFLGEMFTGEHQIMPTERAAQDLAHIPLSKFKNQDQYVKMLTKQNEQVVPEMKERIKAMDRYARQLDPEKYKEFERNIYELPFLKEQK